MASICDLPSEILGLVLEMMDMKSRMRMRRVSKLLKSLADKIPITTHVYLEQHNIIQTPVCARIIMKRRRVKVQLLHPGKPELLKDLSRTGLDKLVRDCIRMPNLRLEYYLQVPLYDYEVPRGRLTKLIEWEVRDLSFSTNERKVCDILRHYPHLGTIYYFHRVGFREKLRFEDMSELRPKQVQFFIPPSEAIEALITACEEALKWNQAGVAVSISAGEVDWIPPQFLKNPRLIQAFSRLSHIRELRDNKGNIISCILEQCDLKSFKSNTRVETIRTEKQDPIFSEIAERVDVPEPNDDYDNDPTHLNKPM